MTLLTLKKRAQNLPHMQHRPARFAALLLMFSGAQFACAQAPAPAAPAPAVSAPSAKPKGPTTIDAQSIEGISELEVTARGRVEFQREDLTVYSEFLRFNQEFGRIEADGGVRFLRGPDRFFGPRLRYNTLDDTGVFEGSNYILRGETTTMRGNAERLEFLGKDKLRLVQGMFTTCEPGKEDWRFEADELEIDNERQVGTLRSGRLKFFDTTILPLPYGSFSLDNQRKSGFLTPYYAHNSRRGLEIGVPYYWNIAPERDLTLRPSIMSKRGEQLRTEFRYMDRTYFGNLHHEYMPHDNELRSSRSAFSLQHQQQITPQLTGVLDLNKVSDSRYFVDLASHVRQVSTGVLQQTGALNYGGEAAGTGYYLNYLVQRWQTLQDPLAPITPPYGRLPQFNFGAARNDIAGRFDLALPGEFVRFSHPTLVDGTRLSLKPTLAAPMLASGYFVTPKIGLHHAAYRLTHTTAGQPEKQSVTLPWMSVDGGLIFDRGVNWFGQALTQTLEPRMFYVYAPFRDQSQIPLFDTGLTDFNSSQIFSENRFAGGDRFGDANQLTVAASSRLVTPNGEEMLRATVGQRYYFSDERVGLTPASVLRTRNQSDLLASVGGRLARNLSFDGTVQYNPQVSRAERYSVSARYAPEIAKVVSASYRYNRETQIKQVDVSGQWPVAAGWYAIGRWNYSVSDSRLLEGIAGFEYNAGCWVFRGVFQRLQAAVQTTSTGLFFQLEFNGFGSLGSDDIVGLLKRSVSGYSVTNPGKAALVPPSMQRLPFEQVF
jgi:LPS-assembly protein